jgi:hypothetical protein
MSASAAIALIPTLLKVLFPNGGKNFHPFRKRSQKSTPRGRSKTKSRSRTRRRSKGPRRSSPNYSNLFNPPNPARNRAKPMKRGSISAPLGIGATTQSGDPGGTRITRSEYTFTVVEHKSFITQIFPLTPGDETFFASLVYSASQFQQFRFNRVSMTYEPTVGTTTAGIITIAPVPTYAAATEIVTYQQLAALPNCVSSSIWKPFTASFPASNFSQQYDRGWTIRTPSSNIDINDPTQVQGFIVVGYSDAAADAPANQYGRLTVSYDVQLFKNKLDLTGPTVTEKWLNPNANADWTGLTAVPGVGQQPLVHPFITMTNVSLVSPWSWKCVFTRGTRPYLFVVKCVGTGLTAISLTPTADITQTVFSSNIISAGTQCTEVAHELPNAAPDPNGATYITVSVTGTTLTRIIVLMNVVRPEYNPAI